MPRFCYFSNKRDLLKDGPSNVSQNWECKWMTLLPTNNRKFPHKWLGRGKQMSFYHTPMDSFICRYVKISFTIFVLQHQETWNKELRIHSWQYFQVRYAMWRSSLNKESDCVKKKVEIHFKQSLFKFPESSNLNYSE